MRLCFLSHCVICLATTAAGGVPEAANSRGGEDRNGRTPLFRTTTGNGLYAADVTRGASVICQASGYSG